MDYKKLDKLNQLRQSGALTDEEFEREKQKIINEEQAGEEILGMKENNFLGVMNFILLIPAVGWILAIIAWAIGKDKSALVNTQGKRIANWIISSTIYNVVLTYILTNQICIGANSIIASSSPGTLFSLFNISMIPLSILNILIFIFPIIGGIKGIQGKTWTYPLAIPFFKSK